MRYVVERGMGASYALRYEPRFLAFLRERVRPGSTVFDVGANRGQMTLFFAHAVGPSGRVVAFEPAPGPFASLRRNVALNRLSNVVVRCAALGEAAGTATFRFDETNPTQGHLLGAAVGGDESCESLRVEVATLDGAAGDAATPDLIKIDTEGAARGVLRGARRLLERASPNIYIELHSAGEQEAVRSLLLECGYVAETLDGRPVPDPTAGWFNPLWCHRPGARSGPP
jgi:FkbM family methyltransferase